MKRRTFASAAAALLLPSVAPLAARAQAGWPTRQVKVVIAFTAGSGLDSIGRIIIDKLQEQLGVGFVVENREGAGGAIGTAYAAHAPADGYTLLFAPTTVTVSPSLMAPNPPYDVVKDLVPITRAAVTPLVVVTSPNAPFKNLAELVAYARENPGKVSYATSGKGAPGHLEIELIRERYKLQMTDVPYKNMGQGMADTLSGQVTFYSPAFPPALPHITSGRLKAIMIGSAKRSDKLPDLPTAAEALGVPGYEMNVWYGMFSPAGTPPNIVAKIDSEIQKTLAQPDVRARIEKTGSDVAIIGHEKFGPYVQAEAAKWDRLIKQLGLKATD